MWELQILKKSCLQMTKQHSMWKEKQIKPSKCPSGAVPLPPSPLPHQFESFSFSCHLSPPLVLSLSLLGEGIMWSSGELNTRAEAAAARWIIDGNLGVTRLSLLTSLLLHLTAGLTRQNGGRERERERKEVCIVWLEDAACRWPGELWMKRHRCASQC